MSTHIISLMDGWLPLTEDILNEAGFTEGDTCEIEVIGDTLVVRPAPGARRPTPPVQPAQRHRGSGR